MALGTKIGDLPSGSPLEAGDIAPYQRNGSPDVNVSGTVEDQAFFTKNYLAVSANKALISDTDGLIIASTTTAVEIAFVHGVTSSIQTQLDSKQPLGITGLIEEGANVTITGSGIESDPYIIASSGGGGGAVDSVFGRTGVVAAVSGDYNSSQIPRATRTFIAAGAATLTANDDLLVINKTSGAATVVNLPAGVLGREFTIKDGKGDAGSNPITLTPAAGTIDGQATIVLNIAYEAITVIYNGVQWNII